MFLDASQDAIATGVELGFARDNSFDFDADAAAVAPTMASVGVYVTKSRSARRTFTEEDRRDASRRRP